MSTKRAGKRRVAKRDPYASIPAKPQYHQRQIPDKRHAKRSRSQRTRDIIEQERDDG